MADEHREIPQESKEFSASGMKADQNLKTHCSFDAEFSKNLHKDISLASKATSIPLTDVSISPTNKNETKTIHLFGTRISVTPQDSSSLASKAASTKKRYRTSMAQDQPTDLLDSFSLSSNPKEMYLSTASPIKTGENLKANSLFKAGSSENPKEEFNEDERKVKKMRSLSNKGKKGEKRTGVSTELDLNTGPPYTIWKTLTASDVGNLSRLMLESSHAESHILSHLSAEEQRTIQEGNGVDVKVYDHDKNSEHKLVFRRWVNTTRSYLFNGDWVKEFVKRRDLKEGDKIGLFWNCVDSKLYFFVLSRALADQKTLS